LEKISQRLLVTGYAIFLGLHVAHSLMLSGV
jgi:ribosomal protein L11